MGHDDRPAPGPSNLEPRDGVATAIIGQHVRSGCDDEYAAWLQKIIAAASHYPGFLTSETQPPSKGQPDWIVTYQFDSVTHLRDWFNSATRQRFLDQAAALFDGLATREVVAHEQHAADVLAAAVVIHRVPKHRVNDFLAWQKKVQEAQSKHPGFQGKEMFRPTAGQQNEWTITAKFDTAEHLDDWLTSADRAKLLADTEFKDFKLRKIDHSFGNWFAFEDTGTPPPSGFKSSIAVWLGLYPTIMLLTLMIAPLGIPLWLRILVANLASSFVMTYLTMPYYSNRILGWWLRPPPQARQPHTNMRGVALVLLINAAWAALFYVITVPLLHMQ